MNLLLLSSGKYWCIWSCNSFEREKKVLIKFMFGNILLFKNIIKLEFFIADIESKMFIENLKNSKSNIFILHYNGILVLWNNKSKHKLKISDDYCIENNIHLLEGPAYSSDLNPIEKILHNIKLG